MRKYIQICGGPMAEYKHFLKVIFIYKFVDPDTKACTNHVENMWKKRSLLSSYLQEFMWRQQFGKNPYLKILLNILN